MPPFQESEAKILTRCVHEFQAWLSNDYVNAVSPVPVVGEIIDVIEACNALRERLESSVSINTMCVEVEDDLLPLLKRAIMSTRRQRAMKRDNIASLTTHSGALDKLNEPVLELDEFTEKAWFQKTEALTLPLLGQFAALSHLEEKRGLESQPARHYQEKFKVLQSPAIFLNDLRYFRAACELRGLPLSVAFLDIDNFKEFNSRYTEESVDRNFLPRFAAALEAHVYNHGFAYQQGGDEYLVLLPNMDEDWSVRFLFKFQKQLEIIDYPGIREKPTVSIGICHVTGACFLTDYEIRERANWAKNYAKEKGRNRIAGFQGMLYRREDICVYDSAQYEESR